MQGINVFASTAARDAAITSPQEGQFAYTKDTNSLWYYTGSAWAASGATGDIEGVTAGVGITGGGTSGTVTITNDMATTITASGDIVVGTGSGTYDNLPIGTTNQVLTADTTVSPYKVKWATPAGGGGKVLQVVNVVYSTQANAASSTFIDTGLSATITPTSATSKILVFAINNGVYKGAAANIYAEFKLVRGATDIVPYVESRAGFNSSASNANGIGSVAVTYLDSPATTSATTYKTMFNASGSNIAVQNVDCSSTITLMEIGA
jgi:hypothetical protein